ncbi:glutathione S-transferase 1-like [Musca domestica]|uniref:Glutathione S-transferase 1-like n=1 Tax=Musca domestica TaxID=7370 RepID=A0A1I8N6K8_MUSDO|nr:glutathione S-transferase 1-like [Musca domestica]
MSKPILYMNPLSAPSRAVMYLVKYLGLELECIEISLDTRETLTPEFRKLNPQHTVPTLVDGHDVIYDSHAICGYLVDKYATNDELYPKGLVQRTLVNARLHFDSCDIFSPMRFMYVQILYGGLESVPKDVVRCLHESWMILEDILKDSPYLCGENMTIADICCLATITAVVENAPIVEETYPKLFDWLRRMCSMPFYYDDGSKRLQMKIKEKLKENRLTKKEVN